MEGVDHIITGVSESLGVHIELSGGSMLSKATILPEAELALRP